MLAGWLRYLTGFNDRGEPFTLSPDPRLEELTALLQGIQPGREPLDEKGVDTLLQKSDIFVVDLFSCGLAEKVKAMFNEMLTDPGAVRRTLTKYCGERI